MGALKWILGGVVALLLVAFGVGAFLISRIDPRAEAIKAVTGATGRDFTIAGDVHVSYFPTLGFHAKDIALANAPGGEAAKMIQAKEIQIGVAVRPLFDKRVEVARLVLVEPRVSLEVDPEGRPNWVFTPAAGGAGKPGADPTGGMTDIKLGDVRIEKGRVVYSNRQTRTFYALEDVALAAKLDSIEKPLRLEGSATYKTEPAKIALTLDKPRAILSGAATPIDFSIAAAPLTAGFKGEIDAKTGALKGLLEAKGPSLRRLSEWAGAPIGAGPGLEAFTVDGRLTLGAQSARFENASVTIDAVKGRGDFVVETGRRVPYVSGRLELMALDLNPYLAPAPVVAPAATGTPAAAPTVTIEAVDVKSAGGWSEARMELGGLKAVNADLDLTTGLLTFQKLKIDKAKIGLVLNDGFLAATLNDLALYGGSGKGRFELDARGQEIGLRQEIDVVNVKADAILADAIGFKNLEGGANLKLTIAGVGRTQGDLMRSLDGAGSIAFTEGAIRGVNLGGVSRTIRDALKGEMVSATARTPFSTFSASFILSDGVAATEDFTLRAKDAQITANGVIDIAQRRLDLRITPRADSILQKIGVSGAGVAVPFRASGPWDKIGYASDLLARARPEVDAKVRSVRQRAAAAAGR
jgi:AsmA protein